jgi:hypothetical protein
MALICNGWGMGVAVGTGVNVSVGAGVSVGSEVALETGAGVGVSSEAMGCDPHAESKRITIINKDMCKLSLFII